MNNPGANNRMVVLLIAGLPLVMLLAATWLWYYVSSGKLDLIDLLGTANRGTLLEPPRQLNDLSLRDGQGREVLIPDPADPTWTMLIPVAVGCDEACRQTVYYTRQIRTAMGKYTNRIDRVYLAIDADAVFPEVLRTENPKLKIVYTPSPEWMQLLKGNTFQGEAPAYFLVDPAGWLMMYYRADDDGKDVMADLNFLLKNSEG